MEATNDSGNIISMDGAPSIGGQDKGFRPMELLLAGLGGCSSIDIIGILKKQRQELKNIEVEIDAEREKDKVPSLFRNIHIKFKLEGNLHESKVKKAIELSMDTYCSVAKTLEKTAKITYEHSIVSK